MEIGVLAIMSILLGIGSLGGSYFFWKSLREPVDRKKPRSALRDPHDEYLKSSMQISFIGGVVLVIVGIALIV